MRIRTYGLLANRHRVETVERCWQLLKVLLPEEALPSAEDRGPLVFEMLALKKAEIAEYP